MTRIVYGVSGEGSGHSSRAREVLRHLLASGHEVKVASYDRGYANLAGDFDVFPIEGLSIAAAENRVSVVRTLQDNMVRLPAGWRKLRELKKSLFDDYDPQVVITDFEPMTAYLAMHRDLPLLTLDNQHRMRWLRQATPHALRRSARLTRAIIRAIVPRPDYSLVTTFHFGEVAIPSVELFPPILRSEVLAARPSRGDHILVYFTKEYESFLGELRKRPRERFVVYGQGREGRLDNLEFHAPSAAGFLAHLAGAKAVVSTAGFTLLTEALHLGKPLFALPLAGQYEQELNAYWFEELGYGKNGRGGDGEALGDFLYRIPEYEARLAGCRSAGNGALFARLDQLLASEGEEARAWHRRRRPERGR